MTWLSNEERHQMEMMTDLRVERARLARRIAALEQELAHARQIAASERTRAALAEQSAQRAWQIATWRRVKRHQDAPFPPIHHDA